MPRHVRQLPVENMLEVSPGLPCRRQGSQAAVSPGGTRRSVQPGQRPTDDRLPQTKEAETREKRPSTATNQGQTGTTATAVASY